MPTTIHEHVKKAISDLQQGKMIIITDDPERENEGDLVIAASMITPDIMNFMIRHGTGIICLPATKACLTKFQLPLMVPPSDNQCVYKTQFTVSVDAKQGISSGVSAADRVKTIQVMIDDTSTPDDLVRPGHLFPLQARDGGILERRGHTEASVDIVTMAGFKPMAVIGEIMNPDGTMAKGKQLDAFAKKHDLTLISIDELLNYRLQQENLIEDQISTVCPLENYGNFIITVVKEKISGIEHLVLTKEIENNTNQPLVRIHSSCMTGDLFGSMRCDCNKQLHYSLERISQEGGILIYLNQEGRGIGLFNKIKAYALQDNGLDTIEANEKLGLPIDSRNYYIAANVLRNLHIEHIRLLTNNPDKVEGLKKYGILSINVEPMPSFQNEYNEFYLRTKKEKLMHAISFNHKNDTGETNK